MKTPPKLGGQNRTLVYIYTHTHTHTLGIELNYSTSKNNNYHKTIIYLFSK